jgi:GGDEF domain-containing protein
MTPLLQHRWLRVLLVAAPGLMAAVAILTATESSLGWVVALNLASAIIISSALFIAVSLAARRVADERVQLTQMTEQEIWRARAQRFSIHNDANGLYADWYFRLRLQEELERSQRYGLRFAVMIVKPIGVHQDVELETASVWFGEHIRRHLRRSDLPALLQDGSLGVIMPSTTPRAARDVQRRVAAELAPVEPQAGVGCFPEDGTEAPRLIAIATERCRRPRRHYPRKRRPSRPPPPTSPSRPSRACAPWS